MVTGERQRGRPPEFDREELLDRAIGVFWRHGRTGATTRILERELGVSQSSLYNAFGSKAELLDLAVERYQSALDDEVLSRLDRADRTGLLDFVDAVVRWVGRDRHRGCLILNLAAEDPADGHRLAAYRTRLRRAIRPAVRSFTDDERLANARVDVLISAVLGLVVSARGGAGRAELTRLRRAIRTQILAW